MSQKTTNTLHWRHNEHDGISQISSLQIYSTVYSGADHRKHQSSASLAFVRGIHRWPVNSPHKGPVTRKTFPFDYIIVNTYILVATDSLTGHHLQNIISEKQSNNTYILMTTDALTRHHLQNIISEKQSNNTYILMTTDALTRHHLQNIISEKQSNNTYILVTTNALTGHHLQNVIS